MSEYKKALLAVSFGTSYTQVIESCIAPVEQAMAAAAPGYDLFRAFTSGMIIKKLKNGLCPLISRQRNKCIIFT